MYNLKIFGLGLFFAFFPSIVISQEYKITGAVKDADTDEKLEAATIFVQKTIDSSLVAYTISNQDGNFELNAKTPEKRLRFLVSYNGYQTIEKYLELESTGIDLGIIKLKPFIFELNETEVIGEIPPILVKKDTLEFNASSFRLRLDATLEDLLRVLPGVSLEENGSIFVNGNQVSGIKVNGKSFFSSDTKIALKNLPIDIIDKVQVVDKKSDLEEFTETESKSDIKEINVTIKKDKNKGFFGSFLAGVGDDGEYQVSGIGNFFNDGQRLTILGGSNNIDNPGFTYDDLSELSSNARNLSWRGNLKGISSSNDFGVNFSDDLNSKTEFIGEYFYSDIDVNNNDVLRREYFLPQDRYVNFSESQQIFIDRNHRLDLNFKLVPDSLTQISIIPRVEIGDDVDNESMTGESRNLNGSLINQIESDFLNKGKKKDFATTTGVVRKLKTAGEYISLDFVSNLREDVNEQEIFNTVNLFNNEGESSSTTTSQLIDQDVERTRIETELNLRKKIFNNFFLIPSLQFNREDFTINRSVIDREASFDNELIERLSTNFHNRFSYWLPNLTLEHNTEKLDLAINLGMYLSEMDSDEIGSSISRNEKYRDLFVDSYISYKLSTREKITVTYSTEIYLPNSNYFLPVPNELDLTNVYLGNPFLDRIYRQDISLNYNNYNSRSKVGLFIYGKLSFYEDGLQIIRSTDNQFIRTITYDNTNGNVDGNFRISLSKTKSSENKRYRYHIGFNSRLYRRNNVSNDLEYKVDRWSLYPTFRFSLSAGEIFSLRTSYSPRIVLTRYNSEFFENTDILSHEIALNTSFTYPKNLIFENDIVFNSRPDIGPGFETTNIFWNTSLGYRMLRDRAILRIRYFDLLNENVKNSRYTGEDYIQDSQSSVLNRYLMLSFSYKLHKAK